MVYKGYIYCVTCLVTNKWYFGQTIYTIEDRWARHCRSSERGSDNKFHRAIRKYGAENFIVEEVMCVKACEKEGLKEKLDYLEMLFIARFDTKKHGYNSTDGGDGIQFLTKESLEKISRKLKGRKFSEATRKKMSEAAKKRIGPLNSNWGNHKLRGENSYWYGKHLPEEVKSKISKSRKGKGLGHKPYNLRKILQINSGTGEIVKIWNSVTELRNNISLNGHTFRKALKSGKVYRGYVWKDAQ